MPSSFYPILPRWPNVLPKWNWFRYERPEENGLGWQLMSDCCSKTWLDFYQASNIYDLLIVQFCLGEDDDSDFQFVLTVALCRWSTHLKLRRIPLPMWVTHYRGGGNRYWWPRRLETGIFLCGSSDDVTNHPVFSDSFLKISFFSREGGWIYMDDDSDFSAKWQGFGFNFNIWDILLGKLQYERETIVQTSKDVTIGNSIYPMNFEVSKYHRSRPRWGRLFTGYGYNVSLPDDWIDGIPQSDGDNFYSIGGFFGTQLPDNTMELMEQELLNQAAK